MINMDSKSAARAVILLKQYEGQLDIASTNIVESISSLFETLATINPELSLHVIDQLNEQINEETVSQAIEHNNKIIDKFVETHGDDE